MTLLDDILNWIDALLGGKKTAEQTTTATSITVTPTTTATTQSTPTIQPIQPITATQPTTTIEPLSPITPSQPTTTTITPITVIEPTPTTQVTTTPTEISTPTPTPTTPTQPDPNVYTSSAFRGKLYYANNQPPTTINQTTYFGRYEMANGQSVNIWMSKHSVGLTFWSDHNGGSGEFLEWQKLVQWIDANYPWAYGGTNIHYQN